MVGTVVVVTTVVVVGIVVVLVTVVVGVVAQLVVVVELIPHRGLGLAGIAAGTKAFGDKPRVTVVV